MNSAIRYSYYHPDELPGLACNVNVDWSAFFTALKVDPTAERVRAFQGLKIRSQALRGKAPAVTFEWTSGTLTTREEVEDGLKQSLGGFYQMYWSMIASSPVGSADEITKIEALPDGAAKVYTSSEGATVVITVDKESVPTTFTLQSPAMNATIAMHFTPTPKPVPGDLRRITSMDVSEEIGTSRINLKMDLDYQAVGKFYVPAHATCDLGGVYSFTFNFSDCSVFESATGGK